MRREIFALPAWPFFLGVALAFAACAIAGRIVSSQPMFENFVRFFSPIQPQRYFYPTASQLVAHIRHTVPKDKTLVLVGGASYFRGTGQNPGELWTLELQRQLGPRYAVVNFAIDQADITSFAAVVFAILAPEYPQIVYVSNGNTASTAAVDGGEDYRYVFWDAYYKGLLPPAVADSAAVRELRRKQLHDPVALEVHLGKWLDQFAYACDLWTYLGYKKFFSVWTPEHREAPFEPRHRGREEDDPHLALAQANTRQDAAYIKHSEDFSRRASKTNFLQTPSGLWTPDTTAWARFGEELRTMFPVELRPKIFVVLLRGNPFFMQTLNDEERRRLEVIYRLGQQSYEREGYQVVPLRAQDFTPDDFVDGGHLMASGGAKIAKAVAARIEDVERTNRRTSAGGPTGPLEITFTLPADLTARQETLVAISSGHRTERLLLEYLGGDQLRLAYSHGEPATIVHSPSFKLAPGTRHTVLASLSGLYPRTAEETRGQLTPSELSALKNWLLVQLDGQPFWEIPLDAADLPPGELTVGKTASPSPTVAASASPPALAPFSGHLDSHRRLPAPSRRLHRDSVGGARVRLTVGEAMAGRAFPLATTGKSGAGDLLFLRITDKGNAVIGYDHWGSPSPLSPEIPLGFGTTHLLEFRLPALSDTATPGELTVTLDGKTVWQPRVPFHRPAPAHIYFGQNPIGATSSEPVLLNATFENVLVPSWRG